MTTLIVVFWTEAKAKPMSLAMERPITRPIVPPARTLSGICLISFSTERAAKANRIPASTPTQRAQS